MLTFNQNIRWLALIIIGGIVLAAGLQAYAEEKPHVVYDKATDRLWLQANNASLKGVLARIGLLSGVEFLMDSDAERPISIILKEIPLETGLKRIMKSHNLDHAMVFQKPVETDASATPLLVSMKVVPNGEGIDSNTSLVPVVDVAGETVIRYHARRPARSGQMLPSIFNYAEERWQARLSRMSPEKRRELEARMLERQEKQAAKLAEAQKRKAKHLEKEAQRLAKRRAAESELKQSNPELYELRQRQREALRQAYLENGGLNMEN